MTRRFIALALTALVASLALTGSARLEQEKKKRPPPRPRPLPAALQEALDKAEKVVLYSLEPDEPAGKDDFHGWKVLGKVEIKDKDARAKAVKVIAAGLVGGKRAKCFDPRHGVRLERQKKNVDLVICFKCGTVRVYGLENERLGPLAANKAEQAAFDKLLRDAKVKLAKPAEK